MAYLTKQKKGNNTYYYLAENIQVASGKRKQIRKYIGTKKPSETKLQVLMAQFEKEVEKERTRLHGRHYLTKDEIKEIDEINHGFWKRYHSLNKTVQEQFDQNFVMDDSKTVGEYVAAKAVSAGGTAEITSFTRLEVGEGIEVAEEDFAAEVAAQMGK